jgi:putative endonuclease
MHTNNFDIKNIFIMTTTEMGKRGEEVAQQYLRDNGFTIRDTNWRCRHLELDIVAEKGNMLHVVEVKTRSRGYLLEPQASITLQKQRNLVNAANAYIQNLKLNHEVQFDIICVVVNGDRQAVDYIPNAFIPACNTVR